MEKLFSFLISSLGLLWYKAVNEQKTRSTKNRYSIFFLIIKSIQSLNYYY